MRKKILKSILFSIFVICGFANSFAQETFSTGLNGWSSAYGSNTPVAHAPSEGVNSDGALQLTRENNNSNFGLNPAGINADTHKIIKFVYKNLTKGTDIRVQGGLASPDNILPTVLSITPELDQWVTGYLDMTGVAGWSGTVDNNKFVYVPVFAPISIQKFKSFLINLIKFFSPVLSKFP